MSSPKLSLDRWVERLSRAELPVLGNTVSQLASVNDYLSSHAAELVRVILHDPNMTAKVLKLANSVLYNQGRKSINTVSRAVVVLGYESIRSICLATFVLEKAASGVMRDELVREVARSFHAAVQAKGLAELRGDGDSEEAFIAALLFHLGEMAFWCFGDPTAHALAMAVNQGQSAVDAQQEIVGFRFSALTLGLTQEWGISPSLHEALMGRDSPESRSRGIRLAHQLASAIERGWSSPATSDCLVAVGHYCKLDPKQAQQTVYNQALLARDTLREYGMSGADKMIPMPPGAEPMAPEPATESVGLRADPALQLSILRELTTLVAGNTDFNLLLQHVLEGLHRGVGLERAVFAIANRDRTALAAKYLVQNEDSDLLEVFQFDLRTPEAAGLAAIVLHRDSFWYNQTLKKLDLRAFMLRCATKDFMITPLWVNNRLIGAFYADCAFSGRPLTQEDFDAFQLFAAQAGLCLQMLSARKA